ncbi:MAG: 3-deoxy-7-phosphoheptulonate synthase, partial [Defluviitaleaceae bacterium]|nr:3-deoxy-7-phosphoheptulonate synthase [Defluviitaleaceae bacterium]
IKGNCEKFLLIIGPCSADNPNAIEEYAKKLARVQNRVGDKIHILTRIYTQKPRTRSQGYMGILHSPNPSESQNLNKGIFEMRRVHLQILENHGLTSADELLYPDCYPYLDDIVSYFAIGARTVESQLHRFIAGGIDAPVGMKNPISGNLTVMCNSIWSAQQSQRFLFRGQEVKSSGNPLAHAILRGYRRNGENCPNYGFDDLIAANRHFEDYGLANPCIIVDVSHSNANRGYLGQTQAATDIVLKRSKSDILKRLVRGLMLESYLEDGRQDIGEGVFGKSLTDPCLGWDKTEGFIFELYNILTT